MVGAREPLANLVIEQRYLVVAITDPPPVGKADLPLPRSDQLLDSLVLSFADLAPADFQERWGERLAPYDRTVDELIMTPAMGKKLWSFLLRKRDPWPEVFVLRDDGDRRALSVAYAIADVLGLRRSASIYRVGAEDWSASADEAPPNRHVYESTKRARAMVV